MRSVDAVDGDEAWALIKKYRPHLAILDVRMPGMSGLELVRAIRADADLAGIGVILLTASAHQSALEAGMAAGANFYLTKPFAPADLLTMVEAALGS